MKKLFLLSAATLLIGGTASAQMTGGGSGQGSMNQQMQTMERENPHATRHTSAGNQANPGNPSGGQNQNPQQTGTAPDRDTDQNLRRDNETRDQDRDLKQTTQYRDQDNNRDLKQSTEMREQGETGVKGHLTPTVTLPAQQKERIRTTVIESGRAPRVDHINFTLRVGAPIPRTIHVVQVPQEIVAIYPQWSGFLYFVSGDEIVVVDPNSYAVVGVLEA